MLAPSLSRAPVAPVELARSLPARSTSLHGAKLAKGQFAARANEWAEGTFEIRETFSASRPLKPSCVF